MRTVAHLSDPHFGRIERATVQALIATVTEARPDVVVISGDLTQRAKEREFQEARQFLDALPSPQIVVPGNHDVPLYNVLARVLKAGSVSWSSGLLLEVLASKLAPLVCLFETTDGGEGR